jgi:hypothetical protein
MYIACPMGIGSGTRWLLSVSSSMQCMHACLPSEGGTAYQQLLFLELVSLHSLCPIAINSEADASLCMPMLETQSLGNCLQVLMYPCFSLSFVLPGERHGYPFWLTGANEHYRKTYFKMLKNLEQKFRIYILTYYVCTQIFRRKQHFLCPILKRQIMNISLFIGHIFVFFTDAT